VSTRSLLRDGPVRALLAAETISVAGSQMTWIAIPWFVLTTTGSPAKMAFVVAAELAPTALFGIASGAVLARLGSRRFMLIADATRTALVALIPTLHLLDTLSFGVLLALVFCIGIFGTPYASAQRVIIPELVGEDERRLGEAMSLFQGATATAALLGPAVAGVLIASVGALGVLYADAATFAIAFVLYALFVPSTAPVEESEEARGFWAGFRFLLREPLIRTWTLCAMWMNVAWSALFIALPVLVLVRYGERPELYGWLVSAFGAGSIVGSLLAYRLVRRMELRLLGALAAVLQAAPLWILVADAPYAVLISAVFFVSLFFPMVNAALMTVRTVRTPVALRPKVNSVAVTGAVVLSPLGSLAAGPALEAFSLEAVLSVTLAGATVLGVLMAAAGLRDRARVPAPIEPQPAR
jgi:MFS family permease